VGEISILKIDVSERYRSQLSANLHTYGLLDAGAHERNRQKVAVRLDNKRETFQ